MRLIPDDVLGATTLWQEARGEPRRGRRAVGNTIRHRMAARYFSDGTVAGTVLRRGQFSGWSWGDVNFLRSFLLDDADTLVRECLEDWTASADVDEVPGALHYLNPTLILAKGGVLPAWAARPGDLYELDPLLLVEEIGDHAFLRARSR